MRIGNDMGAIARGPMIGYAMTSQRPYDPAKFSDGSRVRVSNRATLDDFSYSWKWHHKLELEQIKHAGQVAKVAKSYMYHGGDVIYELEGAPGLWHEQCLEADDSRST